MVYKKCLFNQDKFCAECIACEDQTISNPYSLKSFGKTLTFNGVWVSSIQC
jgi:hypothetical protein